MDTIADIEIQLQSICDTVRIVPVHPEFSVRKFREYLSECLREIRQDNKLHGGDENAPFWDLVMYDQNPQSEAPFIVAVFLPDLLRLYAGSGYPQSVISDCNSFSMSEINEMEMLFKNKYGINQNVIEIPRALAEFWLSSVG